MTTSLRIAGLLGPTLRVMTASAFPLVQPHLYAPQIPPVAYQSARPVAPKRASLPPLSQRRRSRPKRM